MSRADDAALIAKAKRTVDLGGFLSQHGYTVADNDDPRWRALDGPGGKILVHDPKGSGKDWTWLYPGTSDGGTIYDACTRLLGLSAGKMMAALRRAVAQPPPALPPSRGDQPSGNTGTPTRKEPRPLKPLTNRAADFLMKTRGLDRATVVAFAHELRVDPDDGHLVAPHNERGGEKCVPLASGKTEKRFTGGSRDDGAGLGRSLWTAKPKHSGPTKLILIAESVVDAMSAYQLLDADWQPYTQIVSTGGTMSEPGKRKLVRLMQEAKQKWQHTGGDQPKLVDASDRGEKATEARTITLSQVADAYGLAYERCAPPEVEGIKDWNDVVRHNKRAQEAAQEAARAAEDVSADLPPPEEPDEPQEDQGTPGGRGGRGRGR